MKLGKENQGFVGRLFYAQIFAWAGLSLLILRLWFLQGIYGEFYRDRSENNRIRVVRTEPERGIIYDREGRILVRNRPAFHVAALLEDIPDVETSLEDIAKYSAIDFAMVKESYSHSGSSRRFEPKLVLKDVSHQELARVKANSHRLPGVIITT